MLGYRRQGRPLRAADKPVRRWGGDLRGFEIAGPRGFARGRASLNRLEPVRGYSDVFNSSDFDFCTKTKVLELGGKFITVNKVNR